MVQAISSSLFYIFACLTIFFAIAAVTTTRILRAAVSLMIVLLGTAALYVLLGVHFIAGIQVLVYVGGIVVLLVFAVMLTQTNELIEKPASISRRILALLGASLFAGTTISVLLAENFKITHSDHVAASEASALGRRFLDYGEGGYAIPFEVISLLLLAAVIGGIVIANKKSPGEA